MLGADRPARYDSGLRCAMHTYAYGTLYLRGRPASGLIRGQRKRKRARRAAGARARARAGHGHGARPCYHLLRSVRRQVIVGVIVRQEIRPHNVVGDDSVARSAKSFSS